MLRLWTDFNDIYDGCYTWTSLRFAEFSPGEEPDVGMWAELWDYEGNRCYGVVTQVEDRIIHLKLDWSTWVAATQIPDVQVSGLFPEQWLYKEPATGPDNRREDWHIEGPPDLLRAS